MNKKYGEFLVCDDLISDIHVGQIISQKIPDSPKAKVMSGTFGKFNTKELPEGLRKSIEADENIEWKSVYQMEPIERKGKPYRCICPGLGVRFGVVIDLELSPTESGMILVKEPYRNKFKKNI